ncbi:hypothetical protein SCHPADRAFT_896772 [Schizopora paradoxa]|uniref:Uncharacterized protein n=1 Tax=Schizopora paradoxa TaxID=27342 RepID=A0A0H2RIW4_9AGAM|nr:hypothetical protein SCHPADRAFT_896772 [Schizopora paradoxa]
MAPPAFLKAKFWKRLGRRSRQPSAGQQLHAGGDAPNARAIALMTPNFQAIAPTAVISQALGVNTRQLRDENRESRTLRRALAPTARASSLPSEIIRSNVHERVQETTEENHTVQPTEPTRCNARRLISQEYVAEILYELLYVTLTFEMILPVRKGQGARQFSIKYLAIASVFLFGLVSVRSTDRIALDAVPPGYQPRLIPLIGYHERCDYPKRRPPEPPPSDEENTRAEAFCIGSPSVFNDLCSFNNSSRVLLPALRVTREKHTFFKSPRSNYLKHCLSHFGVNLTVGTMRRFLRKITKSQSGQQRRSQSRLHSGAATNVADPPIDTSSTLDDASPVPSSSAQTLPDEIELGNDENSVHPTGPRPITPLYLRQPVDDSPPRFSALVQPTLHERLNFNQVVGDVRRQELSTGLPTAFGTTQYPPDISSRVHQAQSSLVQAPKRRDNGERPSLEKEMAKLKTEPQPLIQINFKVKMRLEPRNLMAGSCALFFFTPRSPKWQPAGSDYCATESQHP